MYKDAEENMDFLPALSPMIFAKYCKKGGHKGDFRHHTENISVQHSWEFIIN
jgi:hypothetical protein